MTTQPDLFDRPDAGDADRLVQFLESTPGWVKASRINAVLGFTKRKTRAIAETNDLTIISYPGSPGYKHARHCTLDELERAERSHISQARKQYRKGLRLRRLIHARVG